MRVYLAARYSRAEELRACALRLRSEGHEVTSRWIWGGHESTVDRPDPLMDGEGAAKARDASAQAPDADRARFAVEDMEDVIAAECCVSWTEEPRMTNGRGGRHVEFGMAYALGKRCVVLGWRENVFHHLPGVLFFPAWADALSAGVFERAPVHGSWDVLASLIGADEAAIARGEA